MAVWMLVFGKNGLGKYDAGKVEEYHALLNGVDLDALKILRSLEERGLTRSSIDYLKTNREELLKYFTEMPPDERERYLESIVRPSMLSPEEIVEMIAEGQKQYKAEWLEGYDKAWEAALKGERIPWQLSHCDQESASFYNSLNLRDQYDGLRIGLASDIVWMTGPRAQFSAMSHFTEMSRESGAYYHHFFKSVLQAFKSNYLLYAHEWSGLYLDDEINDLTSDELLVGVSESKHVPPPSMYDLDAWFIERW